MTTIVFRGRMADQEADLKSQLKPGIVQRIYKFFDEWNRYSHEARVKAGQAHNY